MTKVLERTIAISSKSTNRFSCPRRQYKIREGIELV